MMGESSATATMATQTDNCLASLANVSSILAAAGIGVVENYGGIARTYRVYLPGDTESKIMNLRQLRALAAEQITTAGTHQVMAVTTWAGTAGHYTGRAWRALVWIESQIDWAEVGHIVWHGLLAFAVGVYLAGEFTGRWVHRTNDQLARQWVRLGVPAAASSDRQDPVKFEVRPAPAPVALLVMAQAAATAPANVAPPRLGVTSTPERLDGHGVGNLGPTLGMQGLIHISDPMARAVRLVREGKSQRLAASLCGVSRTSLQRALKA